MHKVKRFEIQIPRNIKVFMSKKTKGPQQQSTGMSIYNIFFLSKCMENCETNQV